MGLRRPALELTTALGLHVVNRALVAIQKHTAAFALLRLHRDMGFAYAVNHQLPQQLLACDAKVLRDARHITKREMARRPTAALPAPIAFGEAELE